ncbi:MAG TPA: hypothetical protein DHV48_19425 [Prolixibacteraceae bacterium]|nr:hypothetical protein [Prolixibacteraceae bacterium]
MKKHIIFSLIFAALFSCTKTIDFDEEEMASQVVVNGVISPNNIFSAYLRKSGSILIERVNNQPTDGTMDLYEDGVLIRQFASQLGVFSATDIMLKRGKSYKMVILSNGKEIITETMIPEQAEVLSIDTTSLFDVNRVRRTQYKVKIKDQVGDDYYRIVVMNEQLMQMKAADAKNGVKYYYSNTQYWVNSEDPVFKSLYNNMGEEIIDMGPENDYYIFPDDYFKGKEYSIQFQMSPNGYGLYSPYHYGENSPYKKLFERNVIHVQRLSKDLYNYLKYLKLYNHYHDNPFSEPVAVYSNVKNGTGIFAGFNDDTQFSFEKTYIPYSMDTIKLEEGGYYYGY